MPVKIKSTILLFFFLFSSLYAQLAQSSGNLLHINANEDSLLPADSIGFWQNGIDDYSSYYADIMRTADSLYLLRNERYSPEYHRGYYAVTLENALSGKSRDFIYDDADDIITPYLIPQNIFEIEQGLWIFDDVIASAFLSKRDSFSVHNMQNRLYHISGRVDSLYFVIYNENSDVKFFLLDLSGSPALDTASAIRLNFKYEDQPLQVEHFVDSAYFIQTAKGLDLYKFEADSFQYIKTLLPNMQYTTIKFKEGSLYIFHDSELIKYTVNLSDTSLSEGQILFEGDIYVDRKFNYAVGIDSGSLNLYSITDEALQKSWDISGLNYCFKPLIDYPDIYFHHTLNVTGIAQEHKLPQEFSLATAYPNPFNGSIVFQLDGRLNKKTEIKIFDIRGRLVKRFSSGDNGSKHRFIWRPNSLSSGIYFALINYGKTTQKIKLCYIK